MTINKEIKKIEEKLDKKETVTRTVLGTDEQRHLSEITGEYLSIEVEDYARELAELEKQIFKQEEVEKMFKHILFASLSSMPNPPYNITGGQLEKLPAMFARYFQPAGLFACNLHYTTIERVRNSLLKTLNMLSEHPKSRHAYIPIWIPGDNDELGEMVPSLLGFHIQLTDTKMIFSVNIRSCDIDFLLYDIWYFLNIADFCLDYLDCAEQALTLNINIFNLHKYKL